MSINIKLPLEYSSGIAVKIYFKRLTVFLAIALIHLILIGFILPIRTYPIFSLIIYFSLVIGTVTAYLLHLSTQKTLLTPETSGQSQLLTIQESARYMEAILETVAQESGEALKIKINEIPTVAIERETSGGRSPNELAETPVEALDLSVRVFNSLKRTGITSVGDVLDLLDKGEFAAMSIRNLNDKSLDELRQKMNEKGFLKEKAKTVSDE